jgi:ferredoxin
MATIELDGNKETVEENSQIRDACEELGVPFGCRYGICGTCKIDIIEGEENLQELTQEEIDMDRDKNHRLACQAKIKQGSVKIKLEEF